MIDNGQYSGILVTIHHFRVAGYCIAGVRKACTRYGLDFKSLLDNGIDGKVLLDSTDNNAMALNVVEIANGQQ